MPLSKLRPHAEAALEVPRDLVLGRYPDFVTGGALPRGEVPVFVFHSLEPAEFGRKLAYLAQNGYQTLSADEHFQVLMGSRTAPDRAVVLSFDDGRGTLWSVGFPLLKKHGMKAVVFLVPGRVPSIPEPAPWADSPQREQGEGAFLSWQEIEAMSASGLVDFQSHTLTHGRIHVGPRVAGFLTPAHRRGPGVLDVPLLRRGSRDLFADQAPLGAPLLESAPRTSEALRFFEEPEVRKACVAEVRDNGGEAFFERRDWRRCLARIVEERGVPGTLETPEERLLALRRELLESREIIEKRTGKPVVHLCYPWHASGPTAARVAREAGYRTAYCGKVPGVPISRSGDDPLRIARIGEDYVELLPGRGRSSLASVLHHKLLRRMKGTS